MILSLSILNEEKRVSNIVLSPLIDDKLFKDFNTLSDLRADRLMVSLYIA